MSSKYLGDHFDIHGGGMDLLFPHHECEIAQSNASNNTDPAKYWMHNNMITINGQKMGKSLGNFITLDELFTGSNDVLEQAYSPLTVRFYILQAHYRSTLDFSNEALQAAQKGLKKLLNTLKVSQGLTYKGSFEDQNGTEEKVNALMAKSYEHMNDDFGTAQVIATLFELGSIVNSIADGKLNSKALKPETFKKLQKHFQLFVDDILGLVADTVDESSADVTDSLMQMILDFRQKAKEEKDYGTADHIRDELAKLKIKVKDSKDGAGWIFE